MPPTSGTKNRKVSGLQHEEDPGSVVSRLQSYFRHNLNDMIILTILSSMTLINFFSEAKLTSLNFFYIVILITGYALGKRFAVLSAFLTILIMWMFILADKSPYLVNHTKEELILHLTVWGGFLILTGWLGSALAKIFHKDTSDELFISPTGYPNKSTNKAPER